MKVLYPTLGIPTIMSRILISSPTPAGNASPPSLLLLLYALSLSLVVVVDGGVPAPLRLRIADALILLLLNNRLLRP